MLRSVATLTVVAPLADATVACHALQLEHTDPDDRQNPMRHHASKFISQCLATAITLVAFTACDDVERAPSELLEDDTEGLDDAEPEEDLDDGDALVAPASLATSTRGQQAAEFLEIEFSGVCGYDDGPAIGTILLLVFDDLTVSGDVHYSWLTDIYPLAATLQRDGVFHTRQRTALGVCVFDVAVDLEAMTTSGTWDCGTGCSGSWPSVDR